MVVISLYVDDLHVIGKSLEMIDELKIKMKKVFEITDLREMSYFLGAQQICQTQNEVLISQNKYAREIMKKF